jgi:N-acetylneuraminic acid mutarotase
MIYVFGGEGPQGTFRENEMYDAGTDTWTTMAPMPTARHGLGAAVVGDTIYVIGGGPEPGLSVTGANEAYTP